MNNTNKKQLTMMVVKAVLAAVFLISSIAEFPGYASRVGVLAAIVNLIGSPLCIYAVVTALIWLWTKVNAIKWKILGTIGLLLVFAFGDSATSILIMNILFIIAGTAAIVVDVKKLKAVE